jgi:two-component system, OmpR family, response regulator
MRILLAEDDRVLADGLSRSLRQAGYALDHANSGTDADVALAKAQWVRGAQTGARPH